MKTLYRYRLSLALCLSACLVAGSPGSAESPPPFKEFSAKRVKAPKKGAYPKIDVQIGQGKTESSGEVSAHQPKGSLRTASYAWFWEEVSPSLSDMAAARLWPALQYIAQPPAGKSVDVMRLQGLQDIATTYQREILMATVGTQVSPALVLAVIAVESAGDMHAESKAGAQGLMQLMPDTATRFGVGDPFAAADNIRGGVAFLDLLMKQFGRDPMFVLAGYNAGENAVRSAEGVPDFVETRDYVPKVLATYAVARGLCQTPPELITDGCVFITR
ncbi:MAG: lytic transglycosylase domain-containing protein [Rhodobacteraceae bacterium]|nr:lytic transglycosylase domain-containing protein [Paracoccaceae bacterium]